MELLGYVTEFQRWRDAPVDQKYNIAREQVLSLVEAARHPNHEAHRDHLLEVIMANGKPVGGCTSDDLTAMTEWSRTLTEAIFEVANGRPACTMEELERGSARYLDPRLDDFIPGVDE